MGFITKKIQTMYIETPNGDVALSAKTGEDPEFKLFVGSVESAEDGMTNDGQLIYNYVPSRSYIQGVFAYQDSDMPKLQSAIDQAKTDPNAETPTNVLFTDGSIYSNSGAIVNPILYNGTGTFELRFESALDFIQS